MADQIIIKQNNTLTVPDNPIIPFIKGDGIGAEIWSAAELVFNAAVLHAYQGRRKVSWQQFEAGESAFKASGSYLPDETVKAIQTHLIAIKGPLATPVGGGIRSLNVALRKSLDLYVCMRPVRWFADVPAPTRHPEKVEMVIFRENSEDLYAGIEFAADSQENKDFLKLLQENFPEAYAKMPYPQSCGIGIKPVSKAGSERLINAALQWAIDNHRKIVTLVHKGNIMKFTEGAFRNWGYDLAETAYGDHVITQRQLEAIAKQSGEAKAEQTKQDALNAGKLLVNDIITDAAFERTLTHPEAFDVIATTNLNGDYLSDGLAAQVGGIGIAPGANINFQTGAAVFEATHGTAPTIAGKNLANPSSLILSGEMMFKYMGWYEAADCLTQALMNAFKHQYFTVDLSSQLEGITALGTQEFAEKLIQFIR